MELNESDYSMTQILADGVKTTYYNLLQVTMGECDEYICEVESASGSNKSNGLLFNVY